MCRLLVCTTDHINHKTGTSTDDKWKRGDVVEVFEDGREFGKGFDNNPSFRIIEIPGASVAEYIGKTSPDTDFFTDPFSNETTQIVIRRRLFSLDLDTAEDGALPGAVLTRGKPDIIFSEKPLLSDPLVF